MVLKLLSYVVCKTQDLSNFCLRNWSLCPMYSTVKPCPWVPETCVTTVDVLNLSLLVTLQYQSVFSLHLLSLPLKATWWPLIPFIICVFLSQICLFYVEQLLSQLLDFYLVYIEITVTYLILLAH